MSSTDSTLSPTIKAVKERKAVGGHRADPRAHVPRRSREAHGRPVRLGQARGTARPAHFISGSYQLGVSDRFYPRRSDLTEHLSAILADEARNLAGEGVPYLQVDSPTYSIWFDAEQLDE